MRIRLAAAALAGFFVLAPSAAMADTESQVAAPVVTSAAESEDDGNEGIWGLAGLLGLIGLAGLKKQKDPNPRYDDRTNPPR